MLLYPIWILLLIPLGIAWWYWRLPSRLLMGLRVLIFVLIVLAVCQLVFKLQSRKGTVVVVADRSYSMPDSSKGSQKELIALLKDKQKVGDALAVIAYGQKVAVEEAPQEDNFTDFINDVGSDASNMTDALELALAIVPEEKPARIFLLTDGKWTGVDPMAVISQATARNIAIDYRLQQRPSSNDFAISNVQVPESVTPGEAFMISSWVYAPMAGEINYELTSGNTIIAKGRKHVPAGTSRLTFRDIARKPGTQSYWLKVNGSDNDPVKENNQARMLVGVEGVRPVLGVINKPNSALMSLLQKGGLSIVVKHVDTIEWSLEMLSNYSGLLLEEVPANKIGTLGMENISAWVTELGNGLMITGGKHSYGPGGYFKSPLEPIMPVSMELRQEHRKLSLALVVALDRSGSMSASVGGGKTKMDLANIASAQVLKMLSPNDEMGVIAVDSSAHIISDCKPISENPKLRSDILRIQSMGGGIFCYTALEASARLLMDAKAGTKHIILFADAADAEEPEGCEELLAHCKSAGITCSVIGLGRDTDVDAAFLKAIAQRGNGRIFFTESAAELPRLFAQDTFMVARSSFIDEPVGIHVTPRMINITQKSFINIPTIGGYNLCYLRNGAAMATVSQDEYAAPIVATWQAGLGRVLCYTGHADGKFTGDIAQWAQVGTFFSSQVRWMAGEKDHLGAQMMVTQQVNNGVCRIQLHLDPTRTFDAFTTLPEMTFLKGYSGRKPISIKKELSWENADLLSCTINLTGGEIMIATLDADDHGRVSLSPICLPYSPEFSPTTFAGGETLDHLATATGGIERLSVPEIWDDIPVARQYLNISHLLALAAMVLLLVEVFERRTGVVGSFAAKLRAPKVRSSSMSTDLNDKAPKGSEKSRSPKLSKIVTKNKGTKVDEIKQQKKKSKGSVEKKTKGNILDAMKQTQDQLNKRGRNNSE